MSGKDILLPYLTALFNKILQTGFFPEEWAEGVIVPIHKSGNKNIVDNYRGITRAVACGGGGSCPPPPGNYSKKNFSRFS